MKYKSGKRERAFEIIADHFKPAGEKAGLPGPLGTLHFQTGESDALFVWEMKGGMADLEWYRSEDDIKWYASLVEQEGGEENVWRSIPHCWVDYCLSMCWWHWL